MNLEQIIKETVAKVVAENKAKKLVEGNNVTPLQQYLMNYESEISNTPEYYFDDIKNINNIQDVFDYYGSKRGWLVDKDLKQELVSLIKTLKSKKLAESNEHSKKADNTLDASLIKFLKNIYKDTPKDKIPEKYRKILGILDEGNLGYNKTQELNETDELGAGYTHFALFKNNNKIADGWDYSELYDEDFGKYDNESIKYYSKEDLLNNYPDNKINDFKIVTRNFLNKT